MTKALDIAMFALTALLIAASIGLVLGMIVSIAPAVVGAPAFIVYAVQGVVAVAVGAYGAREAMAF